MCHSLDRTRETAHKHLFVGSENGTAPLMQFQPFAVTSGDGFLGKVKRRPAYD